MGDYLYFNGEQLFWDGEALTWGPIPPEPDVPEPVFPGGFVPGITPGAVWTWSVGPGASASAPGATRQLTQARGRVLTTRADGHPFAQFTIDGRSDEAAEIVVRESDLWIWRDGVLEFRGRIVGAQDNAEATTHQTQIQAIGYRGMLSLAAKIEAPVTFNAVNQGQVPWQLIEDWQALDGGDWGIVEGVGDTGPNVDSDTPTVGSPVGEVIDRLARRDGGFEWDISPALELDRWYPQRGADKTDVVLAYGGNVKSFTVGTPQFGNAAVATGNQNTTPETAQTAGVASDERGRWTVTQSFPSVEDQATVDAKAVWLRDQASTVEFDVIVTLTPGAWGGRAHIGDGDIVSLQLRSGRIELTGPHRVVEIQAVPGDSGTETIMMSLVGVPA